MTHEVPQLDLKDHASPPLPVFILSHHLGVGDGEGKGVGDGEGEGVGDGETKYHRKLLETFITLLLGSAPGTASPALRFIVGQRLSSAKVTIPFHQWYKYHVDSTALLERRWLD